MDMDFLLPKFVQFTYHQEYHSDDMRLSGAKAAKISPDKNCYKGVAYSAVPVTGHIEFEVEILSCCTKWTGGIGIGIMRRLMNKPFNHALIPHNTKDASGHCMWFGNKVYSRIKAKADIPYGKRSLDSLTMGDRVGVLITSNGDLHFLINNEPQGRALESVYRFGHDIYIAVDHWGNCCATQIIKSVFGNLERGTDFLLMQKAERDKNAQLILERGMKEGCIFLNNIKMVICGPPCIGKTAFKALLLNNPPPLKHHSTPIAARPIRAIERIAARMKVWHEVTEDELLSMLSDTIETQTMMFPQFSHADAARLLPGQANALSQVYRRDPVIPNDEPLFQRSTPARPALSPSLPSTSSVSTDPTSHQPTRDIDHVSEKILRQLASPDERKVPEQLREAKWIHLLDSGGQPQFTDLLRMFVRGNSLYVIVMKVTESLDDKPTFVYSINGKPLNAPKQMTMTNLQIVKNFVCSVSAASRDQFGDDVAPAFVIVATHCDQSKFRRFLNMEQTLQEKNLILQECLREFLHLFVFYNRDSNELIFPVDNLCRWNREKISAEIRERLLSSRSDISLNVKLPIRWYVFDLNIKKEASKEGHGVISLQSCYAIGDKFGMGKIEVDYCLIYLDSLRICIYYPNTLPNVIFTNPQFLIDFLSNIIRVSFVDDLQEILPKGVSLSKGAIQSLKRDGIFDESLLNNLGLTFIPNLFTKMDLLLLLQLLRVISPIRAANVRSPQFFIPILLPVSHSQKRITTTAVPLVITFNSKLVLQGLFPALIVSLLSRQEEPCFFIDSRSPDFPKQLRHAVKLYSEDLFGSVFLYEEYKSIDVYFTGPSQHCYILRKVILEGLKTSSVILGYDEKILKISALVHCNRKHIIDTNDKVPHPITISYKVSPPAIGCSIETSLQTIALTNDRQSCWLIRPSDLVAHVETNPLPADKILDESHVPTILEAIKEIVFEWEFLGVYLGIERFKLNEIKYNCRDQVQVCRKDMIYHWIGTKTATCDALISALRKIERRDIAEELSQLLVTGLQ
ncbi:PREDICTED: uncharacterized protein LOC109583010 [Amphimedon queenslandica]|uniref:Death domain-containing protein n=1 Tax=Amphimedon queenslandica TaxID=400682 RepID=A0AAN0J9H9_AMPQE|nr:PREDICTED: uncharacterized protein LOC109583010 [Amphimedon queenslandica]|eukprot:XP_019853695.1 PREDICTED: uncharacterized protein LOC109583010 [Amphimedon queenslandica]